MSAARVATLDPVQLCSFSCEMDETGTRQSSGGQHRAVHSGGTGRLIFSGALAAQRWRCRQLRRKSSTLLSLCPASRRHFLITKKAINRLVCVCVCVEMRSGMTCVLPSDASHGELRRRVVVSPPAAVAPRGALLIFFPRQRQPEENGRRGTDASSTRRRRRRRSKNLQS